MGRPLEVKGEGPAPVERARNWSRLLSRLLQKLSNQPRPEFLQPLELVARANQVSLPLNFNFHRLKVAVERSGIVTG